VVVSGAIANKPGQGGEAWVRLSYLLGLRRLGYQVHFIEQVAQRDCVDARGTATSFEQSANLAYFASVMDEFGLSDCASLIATDVSRQAPLAPGLIELAASADALLNISGHLAIEPLLARFRNKVFIDIDPGFTQFWHAEGNPGARLAGHDWFFTIGENIGTTDCSIPTGGIRWKPTRPPVVLDHWPAIATAGTLRFSTIANWRGSYGAMQFGGKSYGAKVHEFRKLFELPAHVRDACFEIALNIHPGDHKDLIALQHNGWQIVDPRSAAEIPGHFRRYIQTSGAEFSVAQGIYVETQSGWFSDRTAGYLASGKPALVQNTGFSRNYPIGKGLVPFRTLDEAVAGAKTIAANYSAHATAARSLAETYFDSDRVLGRLMEEIGLPP
jgi:hypothetical protein